MAVLALELPDRGIRLIRARRYHVGDRGKVEVDAGLVQFPPPTRRVLLERRGRDIDRYLRALEDVLIDSMRVEPDLTRRRAMVGTVLRLATDDIAYVPLYRRTLTWAMAKKVRAVIWPNDTAELRWVRMQ